MEERKSNKSVSKRFFEEKKLPKEVIIIKSKQRKPRTERELRLKVKLSPEILDYVLEIIKHCVREKRK